MSTVQIEKAYQETVGKIRQVMEEIKQGNEHIDKEKETKAKAREMERKVYRKFMEQADAERERGG